jgi:hypothetical protein
MEFEIWDGMGLEFRTDLRLEWDWDFGMRWDGMGF